MFLRIVLITLAIALYAMAPAARSQAPSAVLPDRPASALLADEVQKQDLEAQKEMAFWARWQFGATAGSVILSVAALWGLLRSLSLNRDALKAARDSVDIARANHVAQTRAWLSVTCAITKPRPMQMQAGGTGFYFDLEARVKNHGASPALEVGLYAEISLGEPGEAHEMTAKKFTDHVRDRGSRGREAIFPGADEVLVHSVVIKETDIQQRRRDGFITPFVYGCVHYTYPGTSEVRQTRFMFLLTTPGEGGWRSAVPVSDPNWIDQQLDLTRPGTVSAD